LLTIAWDIDDVLNHFTEQWLRECKKQNSVSESASYESLTVNPPHELLNISLDEYLLSLDSFREDFMSDLQPVTETLGWFEEHGHKFRHIALTAVPYKFAPKSASWVITYFGKWIRSFNYVPSYRSFDDIPSYDSDKKSFLSWLNNVDILIEDNEHNIQGAQELGIKTCMFPQPWNVERNKSMSQCLKELTELTSSLKKA